MRKRKLHMGIIFTILLSLALAGCGNKDQTAVSGSNTTKEEATPTEQASKAVSIKHAWGETEFAQTPQKIVTLDFSFIDTLTALGVTPVGNAGVGKTKVPEYLADKVTGVADVGERKAPNLEVIQSLKPDLIIASVDRHAMIRKELEGIAQTVAFDDASIDQILSNVTTIGEMLGKSEEANKVNNRLKAKIAEVKSSMKGSPSVLVVGYFDDHFTVWIKDSFIGTLLTQSGLNYAFNGEITSTEGKGEGTRMALERLHELNPDYIMLYGDSTDKLKSNPLYQDMKAVKEGHLVNVDRDLWARARGPIAADQILTQVQDILKEKSASK
ncbi:ABC transporter substrate-binding protein [Paenibacillus sp. NPDC057934]|uniref:ABC transporter substrate-binding protein n=1 Tax=Paenibacillus sp. NPDC057934 TaxID=3346282 RepID=UPI0036DB183C